MTPLTVLGVLTGLCVSIVFAALAVSLGAQPWLAFIIGVGVDRGAVRR